MKWRHFLLATALSISPVAFDQAQAATLQPESEWAVTRMAAKDPRSAPYCALARKFENNIIMTIARNTRDETSVAIDFQQPLFTTGQSVSIKLGEGRDFLVPPASNKAIVARIGADKSFFDELEQKQGMDVIVMGQSYFFKLPEMSGANAQLSTCLMAMSGSSTGEEQPGVDNKIAALQDQISTLKTQRSSMVEGQDTKTYSNQLLAASGGGANADLAQKIAELQAQNMDLRSKVDSERGNYDNLQTKSLEDKSRLALLDETQDQLRRAQEDTQKFRSQLSETQQKQDELIGKLEKYSDAEQKRRQLEAHLEVVQKEHLELVAQLQAEKDRMELVQAAQAAVLNQQKDELTKTKAQLAQTSQELTQKSVKLNETSVQLSQTSEERDNYKSRLQEFSGIRDKLTALAAEQKNLGSTVESLKSEKTELSTKLDSERARLAEIQNTKADLEKQVDNGKEERAKLEKLLAEEKEKQAVVADLEKSLDDIKGKQKELAGKVDSLQNEKKELQTRVSDLEGRVKDAEAEKEKLSADLTATKTEKEKIAADLSTTQQAKDKIAADLTTAKKDREKVYARLDNIAQEKKQLAGALDDADFVVSQQSSKIDGLTIKQKGLLSQVASLEGEKKELLAQLDTQKTQLASLETNSKKDRDFKYDFEKLKREMADISKERDDLRVALQDIKAKNQELAAANINIKEDDARELFTQVDELEYQGVELNSALEFERQMNNTAPAAGDNTTLAELKASLAGIQAERDEFKRLLDQERIRTAELEKSAGANGTSETVASLSARVKKLEGDNVNLLRELEYEKSRGAGDTKMVMTGSGKSGEDQVTVMRLREEVKRLQKQSTDLEGEQAKLLAQVRMLEAEKQKMAQAQPQSAVNDPKTAAEKEQMKAQIASLQNEKATLTKTLAAQQQALAQQKSISAQPAAEKTKADEAAQREITALKTQLAQAQSLINTRQAQMAAAPLAPVAPAVPLPPVDTAPSFAPQSMAQNHLVKPVVDAGEPMMTASVNVENDLRDLLQKAGIGTPSQFGPVTIPVATNVQAWRWKLGNLSGNAESHLASDAATQNDVIEDFVAKAKSRCPGDFAVIENSRTQTARGLVVSTDIACVSGSNGVAAAIAFVQMGDRLVAIAQEAATVGMADAMIARDKVVQVALGGK